MAIIHPFRAWHPKPEEVKAISCPPYDVISSDEAREVAADNPRSFLHITKPEIDLSEEATYDDARAYEKGAENLQKFKENGIFVQDDKPALFIYELTWRDRTQTGIFGCVSVNDYDDDVILKHELTRPPKEDDRTRHISDQQAHAEPVMLTCKDKVGITDFNDDFCKNNDPFINFKSPDGITHRLWRVQETDELVAAFAQLSHLYIADGHHRCKAASRAAHQEQENRAHSKPEDEFNFFPAVIFPMSQMRILPYNRLVHYIPKDFLSKLKQQAQVDSNASATPQNKGEVCIYLNGQWHRVDLPVGEEPSAVEKLDAYRLQHFILEPLLGINDPRRNDNISFVGGIRGTDELERRIDSGDAALGISMYPTSIEELVDVSDQGLLMPPKSTWFEPKLRSGLLFHTF